MNLEPKDIPLAVTVTAVLGFILTAAIIGSAYRSRNYQKTITVTGSAQQVINSDAVTWTGTFSRTVDQNSLKQGDTQLQSDEKTVLAFLNQHGVQQSEISLQPPTITEDYADQNDKDGNSTQVFSGYTLSEGFQVDSKNLDAVNDAANSSGELLDDGIIFVNNPPEYFYDELANLKIQMIDNATKDATARAQAIAHNADSSIGSLDSASVGVIQITPENSSDLSDEGEYDTTSIRKQVTVVVHASYSIK